MFTSAMPMVFDLALTLATLVLVIVVARFNSWDQFSLESGYRTASHDVVRIKPWVCHSSGTVMVAQWIYLHLLCQWFSVQLSPW